MRQQLETHLLETSQYLRAAYLYQITSMFVIQISYIVAV